MRCVVYVRVSDQSQVDGTSLDTQTKMCREYAEREGYKVARVFREEGVSAKTLNRPEFQKLLEYVPNHKIKAVIVYKVDRLSRNLENQLFIIRTLQEAGVGLHSAPRMLMIRQLGNCSEIYLAHSPSMTTKSEVNDAVLEQWPGLCRDGG